MKNEKIKNRCKKAIKTLRNWTKRKTKSVQSDKVRENINENQFNEYRNYSKRFETMDFNYSSFRVKGVLK